MSEQNGSKSKLIWWLISIIQGIVMLFLVWVGSTLIKVSTTMAAVTTTVEVIDKRVTTLEALDRERTARAINRRDRGN